MNTKKLLLMHQEIAVQLTDKILSERKAIVTDSYEMSIGEIINLYSDGDLVISPEYQRLYRWTDAQKIKLIESILLWFPLPSIFVYQLPDGKWELVDGLQRISTILQFVGILKDFEPFVLHETKKIPEFKEITWKNLDLNLQRDFKRARIRIEILKSTSDGIARFELFQRLNTTGSTLTPQEVRNCTISMLNPKMASFLKELSFYENFIRSISITEDAIKKEYATELVLRFFAHLLGDTTQINDVHEFLDDFVTEIAIADSFDYNKHRELFYKTFTLIYNACGESSFKKYTDKGISTGQFLITKFETISFGIACNLDEILTYPEPNAFIKNKILRLDSQKAYTNNSGSGVRASSRLANLLVLGKKYFSKG